MSNSTIKLNKLGKNYFDKIGNKLEVLKNVSAEIYSNNITAFLAPQGSGKSSLLKIIAGIETHSNGDLICNSKVVFIPSEPSSFPWLTVKENILDENNISNEELTSLIKLVGLKGYEDHKPDNRSIGFRFRISLAKAIAYKADFIILDEVFSLMSSESKVELYELIKKLSKEGFSFIIGTSNITEALYLASEIYLLSAKPGEIISKIDNKESEDYTLHSIAKEKFISKRNNIENIFKKEYSQVFAKLTI